jgi:hypothetical protein
MRTKKSKNIFFRPLPRSLVFYSIVFVLTIGIIGIFFQDRIYDFIHFPKLSQSQSINEFIPPNSSWEKYVDPGGNFSIWFPTNWEIIERQDTGVTMCKPDNTDCEPQKEIIFTLGSASCTGYSCTNVYIQAFPMQHQFIHDNNCRYEKTTKQKVNTLLGGLPVYYADQGFQLLSDSGFYNMYYSYSGFHWESAGGFDSQINLNSAVSSDTKRTIDLVVQSFRPNPYKPLYCE